MPSEDVRAALLRPGDVVRVDGEDGWWVVDSAFQEGSGGPIDLELLGEDGGLSTRWLEYRWHVGPEQQVKRRR